MLVPALLPPPLLAAQPVSAAATTPDTGRHQVVVVPHRQLLLAALRPVRQVTAIGARQAETATARAQDLDRARAAPAIRLGRAVLADRGADRLTGADLVVPDGGPGEEGGLLLLRVRIRHRR